MTRYLMALAVAMQITVPGLAKAEDSVQDTVLTCFAGMGATTDWNTCLNSMFAPCATEEVGSEGHIACLAEQREDWRVLKRGAETEVLAALTEPGLEELSGLMLAWPKFVDDKCHAVAEARADISYDAAALGCQISEMALMANELTACLAGRSVEDYCQKKD